MVLGFHSQCQNKLKDCSFENVFIKNGDVLFTFSFVYELSYHIAL